MTPDTERIIEALKAARGCGCCGSYDEAFEIFPDDCPTDEWGVDHQYDAQCVHDFDSLLRKALRAIKEERP